MGKKVMVVDDSRIVHKKIIKLLEGSDYDVVCCCNRGEEALAYYREYQPDVVTMDIVMPGADGFDTARKILQQDANAKILMVSSLAYDDMIDEAVKIGAKGFVFKPFDQAQLINSLQHALK